MFEVFFHPLRDDAETLSGAGIRAHVSALTKLASPLACVGVFDFTFWFFFLQYTQPTWISLCLFVLRHCSLLRVARWIDIPSSRSLTAKLCRRLLLLQLSMHFSLYPETACVLSADVFPSNDEVCAYLLEYVCSRGPLRPTLCPALLLPISLTLHSYTSMLHHRRNASRRGLPAWRTAQVTSWCTRCCSSRTQWGSDVRWIRSGNMLDMARSFATPLSFPFNPPAHIWNFFVCFAPGVCGCCWGENERG